MATERIRLRIERLLDEAEEAADRRNWQVVRERAETSSPSIRITPTPKRSAPPPTNALPTLLVPPRVPKPQP